MPAYLATYDYHRHRDYSRVYKLMDHLGAVRLLESSWLVNVNARAPELRDALIACGDGDESFAVLQLVPNADWATAWITREATDWLSADVTPAE